MVESRDLSAPTSGTDDTPPFKLSLRLRGEPSLPVTVSLDPPRLGPSAEATLSLAADGLEISSAEDKSNSREDTIEIHVQQDRGSGIPTPISTAFTVKANPCSDPAFPIFDEKSEVCVGNSNSSSGGGSSSIDKNLFTVVPIAARFIDAKGEENDKSIVR